MRQKNPKYPELRDRGWWKKNWNKSNPELAKQTGCSVLTIYNWRKKMQVTPYRESGYLVGKKAEDFVIQRIKELGGNVESNGYFGSFDLKLGNLRIEVKSSAPGPIWKNHPSHVYRFGLGFHQHQDCDFYVLVAKYPEDWACFIVPSSVIDNDISSLDFRWPSHHPQVNPWARYLERWDLLGLME